MCMMFSHYLIRCLFVTYLIEQFYSIKVLLTSWYLLFCGQCCYVSIVLCQLPFFHFFRYIFVCFFFFSFISFFLFLSYLVLSFFFIPVFFFLYLLSSFIYFCVDLYMPCRSSITSDEAHDAIT